MGSLTGPISLDKLALHQEGPGPLLPGQQGQLVGVGHHWLEALRSDLLL